MTRYIIKRTIGNDSFLYGKGVTLSFETDPRTIINYSMTKHTAAKKIEGFRKIGVEGELSVCEIDCEGDKILSIKEI